MHENLKKFTIKGEEAEHETDDIPRCSPLMLSDLETKPKEGVVVDAVTLGDQRVAPKDRDSQAHSYSCQEILSV